MTLWRSIPSCYDPEADAMLGVAVFEVTPGLFDRMTRWFPARVFCTPSGRLIHAVEDPAPFPVPAGA